MTQVEPTWGEKLRALRRVVGHDPVLASAAVAISLLAAFLEAVGVSMILPLVALAESSEAPAEAGGPVATFVDVFAAVGVPFSLEAIVAVLAVVVGTRFLASFVSSWTRVHLSSSYTRSIQEATYRSIVSANVAEIDDRGSDNLLNTLITETRYAGQLLSSLLTLVEQLLFGLAYVLVALLLAPRLTVLATLVLGMLGYLSRAVFSPSYAIGDRVATANERIQSLAQAGTQGIRDVKLFGLESEFLESYRTSVSRYQDIYVRFHRNRAGLDNLNQGLNALVVFGLVYVSLGYTTLSLGAIGVFLFAMFRLSPVVGRVNNLVYSIEGELPHLVRVQELIVARDGGGKPHETDVETSAPVTRLSVNDVSFTYGDGTRALSDVSLAVERGETVALVGPSGAGKSTLVSLIARFYEPDDGNILANGRTIAEMDPSRWRARLAVVRQHPYIFDDTLEFNLTIGDRQASRRTIEWACEIAQVTAFLDDLPEGLQTDLGDDGIRLSGGQRQRVAIARALVRDADVLILDEATSEVDTAVDMEIQSALRRINEEQLIITVAHRPSTVEPADRIFVFEDGTVVETGTHDALIEESGVYAGLYGDE